MLTLRALVCACVITTVNGSFGASVLVAQANGAVDTPVQAMVKATVEEQMARFVEETRKKDEDVKLERRISGVKSWVSNYGHVPHIVRVDGANM